MQFASDTGPLSPLPDVLYTNANVLAAIASACGQLESACLRGEAYAVPDLQALMAQDGVSAEYLKTIVSSIAMYNLVARRAGPAPPQTTLDKYNQAMDQLDALSRGERIFSFAEVEQAGVAETIPTPQQQGYNNNLITARWSMFWGDRQAERRFF